MPYASDGMKELLVHMIKDMQTLRAKDVIAAFSSDTSSSSASPSLSASIALQMPSKIRFRCEQIQAYVIQKSSAERTSPIPPIIAYELVKRLRDISERSLCIDSLESKLIPEYFEPVELWFFQDLFLDSFLRTLRDFSIDSSLAVSFFRIPTFAPRNLSPECPEEYGSIAEASVMVSDQMSLELAAHIASLLRELESKLTGLDSQMYPIEAAYRAERSLIAKKSGKSFIEPLPGSESKSWAFESIKDHVYIKSILCAFVRQTKQLGRLVVHNREYSLVDLVRVHVETFLKSRIDAIFNNDKPLLEDLPQAVKSFDIVCKTAQFALSSLSPDFPAFFREFLFCSFCPTSIPPPGVPIPSVLSTPPPMSSESNSLIWTIAKRFVSQIESMATSKTGFIYIKSMKLFAKKHKQPIANDCLKSLCAIVGVQGIRAINFCIGRLISEKVT